MDNVKIHKLEIENVKRVKAVTLEPTQNGLTIIGGKNRQGKTSVLDSIAWALGGNKFKPSQPQREGSVIAPTLHIELSNGLIVERKGKNGDLKVIDPAGNKSGQKLLDSFIEELALDLPKFMNSNNKEKANTLLQIIGVGEQLGKLEQEENELYQERLFKGRVLEQKRGYLAEMPFYEDAPEQPVSASELIQKQQSILAKNGENQRKRARVREIDAQIELMQRELNHLTRQLNEKKDEYDRLLKDAEIAHSDALDLLDESTTELEENIKSIEELNQKVRLNQKHAEAKLEVKRLNDDYDAYTVKINEVRDRKRSLLDGADLPLKELSIEDQELTYKGQKWDNMSSSEQLKVATAIVRKLNPKCGFVLMDKLEMMDLETMNEFGQWLEQEGLQVIATRVSTGDECSIIIEDGYVQDQQSTQAVNVPDVNQEMIRPATAWKAGSF